ncbi:SgrR family transcriptional regulator [Kosakonia cowanii]|uniref:SgrR family transcriptional regulator n=1 Tax=Kosakonia cowanii TaxID=208223 RepID=UPI00289AACD5|nr:SgrR family transcriptional regulator [Kosakonia cowanii]
MVYYSAIEKGSLLRRYNRLLAKYSTHRHELSLAQIADTLACTARYARSLLQEMQEEGWLIWRSRPGRGALGVLQCQMSVAALENMLGSNTPAAEAKSVPENHGTCYSRDGFHYHISFYRPLQAPVPSIHTDRAGRHILQMVHAGLTRHLPEQAEPVPCLAHTIRVSDDGLSWHFMLRRGLVWHNGEALDPAQLQTTLQRYAGGPGLPHVTDVIVQDYVLIMHLSQPDAMLLYRLASPVYALAHPENGVVGLGPFQLGSHSDAQMTLTRAPGWHGEMPQASEIVYNTPLAAIPSPALVRLDTPRSHLSPEPMIVRESSDAFYYVTFNQRRGRLSLAQQAVIRQIAQSLARAMMEREETLAPLPEWLLPPTEPVAQALLPATLNITYFRSTEMKKLVDELIKSLRYRGCTVNTNPISVSHWLLPNQRWEEEDLCLGFLRFDQHETFSLEERYRHSEMWTWFWGHSQWLRGVQLLDRINAGPAERHGARIRRMMRFLKTHYLVVPLFAQLYRLTTPVCIKNIACYAQAWPDYSRIWTDEREEEGGTTLNKEVEGE